MNQYSWYSSPRTVFFFSALALFLFMQTKVGMPLPMHYVFIILSMMISLFSKTTEIKFNWSCVIMLCAMVISIVSNDIPVFFKPWQRFSLFSMLMIGCSPLIQDEGVNRTRRGLCIGSLWALGLIAIVSCIGYFVGYGDYMTGIVNSYKGITSHANFLGFFTMVASVWFSSLFFRSTEIIERVFFALCWGSCLLVLLLASSRSALAGALAGTVLVVYLRFQESVTKLMTSVFIGFVLVLVSLPHIMVYTEAMMKKNMDFEDTEGMVEATRGGIWELRFAEIEKSPWVGVGAYSCDTTLPFSDIYFTKETGTIELGSSYLGMLSQCGLIGFIAFLLVVLPIILKTYRYATREKTPYAQLYLSLIFVVASNMIFEAYLITAGAVQCIVLWLVLSASDQCDVVADYPVFWEKEEPLSPEDYVAWKESQEDYE